MEMVMALLVGTLVVLMAMQISVLSVRGALSQERVADDISRQLFATDGLMPNLRLAGLGIDESVLSYPAPKGILIHNHQLQRQSNGVNLSHQLTTTARIKNGHTDLPSDQLTIIYRAPQDMRNCEGEMVLGPRRARLKTGEMGWVDGQVVIERYFVQHTDGVMSLRCDAAKFITEDIRRDATRDRKFSQGGASFINAIIDEQAKHTKKSHVIYGLGGRNGGQVMAYHVDGMWVRLGVKTPDGIKLMMISEYDANSSLPIVSLDVVWLSHSPMILPADESDARSFQVFDRVVHLTHHAGRHDRRLHQMSIDLRNALL